VESAKTGGSLRAILDGVVWVLKTLALGAAVTGNGFLALGEAMGAGLAAGVAGLKGNVAQAQAILGELETSLAARRDRVIQFHDSLFNPKPVEAKTPEVKPTGESVVGRLARSAGSQDTSGARLALIKANAEAELRLLQDSLKRAQEAYDRAFEDHLMSIRDFHAAKAQIAQAALDAEIAARQQELAEQTKAASTGKDEGARLRAKAEVRKLEAELIVLNRERADVEIETPARRRRPRPISRKNSPRSGNASPRSAAVPAARSRARNWRGSTSRCSTGFARPGMRWAKPRSPV
jgi:hypothetical protein